LALAGLVVSPVAALVVLEVRVNRALVLLPFAALIAALGAEWMLTSGRPLWRHAAIALMALMPLQFGLFCRDYFTTYRETAAYWFERNIRGAMEEVIARDRAARVPSIYITRTPRWIDWYWTFYTAKAGRPDLAATFAPPREIDFDALPSGSVIVGELQEVEEYAPYRSGRARRVAEIREPDGRTSFLVFEK
jgi:hypothetical protein